MDAAPLTRNKGYTLVEIMIVVVVIGTMLTLYLTNAGSATPKARAQSDLQTIRSIQSAVDHFVADYGRVPSCWGNPSSSTGMTEEQRRAMIECLTGTYKSSEDPELTAFVRNNVYLNPSAL